MKTDLTARSGVEALVARIAGVDDAGRGPIIGPLVIAGVLIASDRIQLLSSQGVKDSKELPPSRRRELYDVINRLSDRVVWVDLQPSEIDDAVLHGAKFRKLNFLEARAMAKVIEQLGPDEAYIDASDTDEARFEGAICDFLPTNLKTIKIICKHHADSLYPVVSAASIMAKVRRDEQVAALREQYGDFGSGYVTDPKTIKFLTEWRKKNTEYPSIVRKSWKTIRDIERAVGQTTLTE